jgi:hypothetical protein
MPINSRRKGFAEERALVRFLQAHGFAAEKCSRAGYTGPDLSVPVLGIDRRVEVKIRANGFQRLYDWLTGADMLIVRCDRREPLVVIPLKLAAEIAAKAEGCKTTSGAPSPKAAFCLPPIGDA